MPKLIVTNHAIDCYRERVADLATREICARLTSSAFQAAAEFGAPYVRLSGGQRAVIVDHRIVTILPSDQSVACFHPDRDAVHLHGHDDA